MDGPFTKSTGTLSFLDRLNAATPFGVICSSNPILVYGLNQDPAAVGASKESIQMRPETSPSGLVRRSAGSLDWEFHDILEQSAMLVRNSSITTITGGNINALWTSSAGALVPESSTALFGMLDFVDPSWDSTVVILNNVTGSFRFEIITCVEFVPATSTVLYEVSTASPSLDEKLLKGVETAARAHLARPSN
jgi:hypothetical protein